ncbi:LysM peptidoglycan-binding domain-containing protein [Caloranaerobacter ferrireducens]|uniref:LysM peptidoglycan-binding domain-containing protein n=1 Tax=Caloranaerobacter ferrireducens TaxID=1323370 RepID=UPI00084D2B71|nr:glycoside hydrolase family 18 protein [Caloranaerobacter ferrireducens]
MKIHVVKPGDSVWSIARKYGTTPESIIEANQLQDLPYLIEGQALVIPKTYTRYVVKPGDTVWTISRKFGVTVDSIIEANNLPSPNFIYPGMILIIPSKTKKYGVIEVNGYIEPTTAEKEKNTVQEVGEFLTYISPFSYQVNADGTLNPIKDETILEESKKYDIAPLLVVTNFRGGNFDTKLAHTILTDEKIQNTLIDNIIKTMKNKGYKGLNIDFERIPPSDRDLYNNFLTKVVNRLKPLGYPVSTALAPKTYDIRKGAWHGAHDYKAHGEIVDFVILMTYEWGWSGGPPMAVAPINQVKKVLDYALTVIPSRKIMIGIPLYGYDWTLPYMPKGEWAKRVSPQTALKIAAKYGAKIEYDKESQAPYFNYIDEERNKHIVWFEDARSIKAKFKLVNRYNLRGVSYWLLGLSFPQNWVMLDELFVIKKI